LESRVIYDSTDKLPKRKRKKGAAAPHTAKRIARPLSDREFEDKPARSSGQRTTDWRSEVEQTDDREKIQTSDDRNAEFGAAIVEAVIEVAVIQSERGLQIEQTIRDDGSIATDISVRWSEEDTVEKSEPEEVRTVVNFPRFEPLATYQPPPPSIWEDDEDLECDEDLDEGIEDGAPTRLMLASPAEREESFNRLIDWALGQRPGDGIDPMLRVIVECVERSEAPLDWRRIAGRRLPPHVVKRLDHVFEFDYYGHKRHAPPHGHNSKPTGKLAADHLRVIKKTAGKLVGGNEIWFDQIVNVGLEAAEKAELTFDPTLGFTFWTHAFLRVDGAMKDALERQIRTIGGYSDEGVGVSRDAAMEKWKWEAHGRRSKQNRDNTGAKGGEDLRRERRASRPV
jgi:hypothetical protein